VKPAGLQGAHAHRVTARSRYVIEVEGTLPTSLALALADFDITDGGGSTVLTGDVADSAALYGLLARLESFGVQLVAVHPTQDTRE
jgi:hypothetical protein